MTNMIGLQHELETCRDPNEARHEQQGAVFRQIADRAVDNGRMQLQDYFSRLERPAARYFSSLFHGQFSPGPPATPSAKKAAAALTLASCNSYFDRWFMMRVDRARQLNDA